MLKIGGKIIRQLLKLFAEKNHYFKCSSIPQEKTLLLKLKEWAHVLFKRIILYLTK